MLEPLWWNFVSNMLYRGGVDIMLDTVDPRLEVVHTRNALVNRIREVWYVNYTFDEIPFCAIEAHSLVNHRNRPQRVVIKSTKNYLTIVAIVCPTVEDEHSNKIGEIRHF